MKKIVLFILLIISNIVFSQTFKQYLKAGNKAYEKGEYYSAISYFNKANLFHKKSDDVNYKIGLSYLELKDYDNSLKALTKVKRKSSFPLLLYKIGNGFMQIGNYNEAIKYYKSFNVSYREKDFYFDNSNQKIASCYWALDHQKAKEVLIETFDNNINTEFSEFSASIFKDSLLQLTSFFQDEEDKNNRYISDIFFYKNIKGLYQKINIIIPKKKNLQLANGYFLEEKQRFYFNQCEETKNGNKRCDIYVTEYKNNKWSDPVYLNINDKKFTSTQPMVYVNNEGKDVLLFVSDRDGGFGKKDIWTSIETEFGLFKTVNVLPETINSKDDEASPFYVNETQTLYFSSKWHYGYGGYDIFEAKGNGTEYKKPENLGLPYNSSANDLYFNINQTEEGLFSSNRTGATKLRGVSCCYDIFKFEKDYKNIKTKKDSISKIDSLITVHKIDSVELLLNKIRKMLPIEVYFHNDEPNPKTEDTITNLLYTDAYNSYKELKNEYYQMNDFEEIDAFFYDYFEKGYTDLKSFKNLLALLAPKNKIKLEIKAYCSPLALNEYNINLSKRRISNLENELNSNKIIEKAIIENKLKIVRLPFGEEKAAKGVSDDFHNVKESIYNPKAAKERKVSIIGIFIE